MDLDILGSGGVPAANRLTVGTIAPVCFNSSVQNTRAIGPLICQKEVTWAPVTAEGDASAFQLNPATPSTFAFTNNAKTNAAGSPRGYKVAVKGYAHWMYPPGLPVTRAMSWAFNQLARRAAPRATLAAARRRENVGAREAPRSAAKRCEAPQNAAKRRETR